jgi:uncharacterized protein
MPVREPPFHWGSPATGPYFTGRDAEVIFVTRRVRDHINVVLHSPRRFGKSSIIKRAGELVESKGGLFVTTWTSSAASTAELAASLLSDLGSERGLGKKVLDFVSHLSIRPSITLTPDGLPSFSFEVGVSNADSTELLGQVIGHFGDLAKRKVVVLAFDEFQAVVDLDPALPAAFKAFSDANPRISFVFAGSHRHLMEKIFVDEGAPLLRIADPLEVRPIAKDAMTEYLSSRSRDSGIEMTDGAAESIYDIAAPAPNDVQHLALDSFYLAERIIDTEVVDAALTELVERSSGLYTTTFEDLTSIQKRLVRLLAFGPRSQLQSAEVTREIGAANPSGVSRALAALEQRKQPLVARDGGSWRLDDPFFGAWLRSQERNFPSSSGRGRSAPPGEPDRF